MARQRKKPEGVAGAAGEPAPPAEGGTRTARVTLAGFPTTDVTIPADAASPEAAAVQAFQQQHGLWSLPQQPHVELDPPAADAESGDADSEGGETG